MGTTARYNVATTSAAAFGLLAAVAAGASIGLGSKLGLLPLLAVLGVIGVGVAISRPVFAFGASIAALALLPMNGLPVYGFIHPAVVGSWLIVVVGFSRFALERPRFVTPVDCAVGVIFAGYLASAVLGVQPQKQFITTFVVWGGPFLAARMIVASSGPRGLLTGLAIAGAVALPFGVVELVADNPFFNLFPYGSDALAGIGVETERLGSVRTQGAFGQPIPYAMFLASAALSAGALWMSRRPDPLRSKLFTHRWLLLAVALVAMQATTLSRTGWLMLVVSAAVIVVVHARTIFSRKNAGVVVVVVAILATTLTVPSTRDLVLGNVNSPRQQLEIRRSGEYRAALRRKALEPGYVKPFGSSAVLTGPGGLRSIDNAYIVIAWKWGYLPIVGFLMLFGALAVQAVRARKSAEGLMLCALGISVLVALAGVAIFGQTQVLVWLVFGAAAGLRPRLPQPDR